MYRLDYEIKNQGDPTYYFQIVNFLKEHLGIDRAVFYSSSLIRDCEEVDCDEITKENNLTVVEFDKSIDNLSLRKLKLYLSKALTKMCGSQYYIVGKENRDLVDKLINKVTPLKELCVILKSGFDLKAMSILCNNYSIEEGVSAFMVNGAPIILEGYSVREFYELDRISGVMELNFDGMEKFKKENTLEFEDEIAVGENFILFGDNFSCHGRIKEFVSEVGFLLSYRLEIVDSSY